MSGDLVRKVEFFKKWKLNLYDNGELTTGKLNFDDLGISHTHT